MTAMACRVACLLTALALAGLLLVPGTAGADGDPASDYLLAQDVFYPFQPPVSGALQRRLNAETAATRRAGLVLKVAIIHSAADLGAVPTIFGHPQGYADFLEREISFDGPRPLLVVMPDGYGVAGMPAAVRTLARTLRPPAGQTSDDLARAAVPVVARVAAGDGHPIPPGDAQAPPPPAAGSSTWIMAIALVVVAVIAAGSLLAVRRRRVARRRALRPSGGARRATPAARSRRYP